MTETRTMTRDEKIQEYNRLRDVLKRQNDELHAAGIPSESNEDLIEFRQKACETTVKKLRTLETEIKAMQV